MNPISASGPASATGLVTRFPRGLYGITPEWDDTNALLSAVSAAASGGMVALQWRRKHAPPDVAHRQAQALAALCRELSLVFIINDDWRLAQALDADGVHLGRDDGDLADARRALGPDKLIGRSCYDQSALAAQALTEGADYVAFGTMYPSQIKPDAVRATPDHLSAGRSLVQAYGSPRPAVVAIGGITADNAAPLVAAGADSLALISGLFDSADIQATAARCTALFAPPSGI